MGFEIGAKSQGQNMDFDEQILQFLESAMWQPVKIQPTCALIKRSWNFAKRSW